MCPGAGQTGRSGGGTGFGVCLPESGVGTFREAKDRFRGEEAISLPEIEVL